MAASEPRHLVCLVKLPSLELVVAKEIVRGRHLRHGNVVSPSTIARRAALLAYNRSLRQAQ